MDLTLIINFERKRRDILSNLSCVKLQSSGELFVVESTSHANLVLSQSLFAMTKSFDTTLG